MDKTYVGIRCSAGDQEMIDALNKSFPNCTTIRSDELEGAEVFFMAIIPLAGFTLQLLDFILNHFVPKKNERDPKNDLAYSTKREIVAEGKSVSGTELEGMSEQEVKKTVSIKLNIDFEVRE